ncbi:MAG: hypothetical protein V1796_00345 [Pseudomonadota bacterium]
MHAARVVVVAHKGIVDAVDQELHHSLAESGVVTHLRPVYGGLEHPIGQLLQQVVARGQLIP